MKQASPYDVYRLLREVDFEGKRVWRVAERDGKFPSMLENRVSGERVELNREVKDKCQ